MQVSDSGIILYAKKAGITSFSSLWDIKHALHTKKVGHTGTLDSFADGLLVVLTGSMTRLVSHITDFDKTYEAIIRFGVETDTLDPNGQEIKTAPLPSKRDIENVLVQFKGDQLQIPPLYSALHVDGKRASDLARKGKTVDMKSRPIKIFDLSLIEVDNDDSVTYAHICVSVSKGTYIRSLARDIAYACSSCAHLIKLRRTSIGSFLLKDACFSSELEDFSLKMLQPPVSEKEESLIFSKSSAVQASFAQTLHPVIKNSMIQMDEETARLCGFTSVILKSQYEIDFLHGRTLRDECFLEAPSSGEHAVFLENKQFCGLIEKKMIQYCYKFVLPSAFIAQAKQQEISVV